MLLELGRQLLQLLYRRFSNQGRENGCFKLHVMRKQARQNSCTADRRSPARPPDVQPVLGRALPGVIVALTLGRKRSTRQPCFKKRRSDLLESLAHTHPFPVSMAYFT